MAGSIIVVNASSSPCQVFVSKYSGGNDNWFTLAPGQSDSWARDGWELVAFKSGDANYNDRAGVYVRANSTITYRGLHNISTGAEQPPQKVKFAQQLTMSNGLVADVTIEVGAQA
ncbi:hypothetical protein C8Q77DRAFT_1159828 [Trametes polyzona]|nr:hypothetical protein C8Q77DRAFT_1159828 [Trametes polyzona]